MYRCTRMTLIYGSLSHDYKMQEIGRTAPSTIEFGFHVELYFFWTNWYVSFLGLLFKLEERSKQSLN